MSEKPKSIIAAHDKNRVIGYEGDMPWQGELPADMEHFVELTTGQTVIMGRVTYDSIGHPLPNRQNIVLTNQNLEIEGTDVADSLDEALNVADREEIFIIGGAKVYHIAMPEVDKMYITEIDAEFEGDTYFPEINEKKWQEIARESHNPDENNQYGYTFIEYERR